MCLVGMTYFRGCHFREFPIVQKFEISSLNPPDKCYDERSRIPSNLVSSLSYIQFSYSCLLNLEWKYCFIIEVVQVNFRLDVFHPIICSFYD